MPAMILALYDWIAERAGGEVAFDYTSRIEAHATRLATFPERGTPRDDLSPGLRTTPYRRRTVIAYPITDQGVEVLRLVHAGQDIDGMFEG
ncbi:MAG: type II toxin-antitoxin system RelE/ParE family toxin [Novosphingobium sp.]